MGKLGFELNFYRKPKALELFGYKKVPTHCYSNLEVDEQWVQGLNWLGNPSFPRYHLLKKGKKWYLHCDWNAEHENVFTHGEIIDREVWRLKHLFRS